MPTDPTEQAEPQTWERRVKRANCPRSAIKSDMRFEYPWDGLEDNLREDGREKISLVGYGSLLNPASAARTIADTPEQGQPPVLAFGARRLFNYVMPQSAVDRYGASSSGGHPPQQRAAYNAVWTGDPADVMNGRMIPLAIGDLDGLREREKGYNLEPVAVVPWDAPETPPSLGFVLCATEKPWQGKVYVDPDIEPFPPYLQLCREGAEVTSPEFERCLIDTSWMADGTTPLREWL